MSELYHIYCIKNRINGKTYIGQSKEYKKRWKAHIHTPSNAHLARAFKKYGIENFDFELLLCTFGLENANYFEKMLIAEYNTFYDGYNLTKGGDGASGVSVPEERRKKISDSQKGEKCILWGKKGEDCHNYGENNGMYGIFGKSHPKFGYELKPESMQSMRDKKSVYRYEQYTKDGVFVAGYDMMHEVVLAGFTACSVSKVCQGDANTHKGFIWKRFFRKV